MQCPVVSAVLPPWSSHLTRSSSSLAPSWPPSSPCSPSGTSSPPTSWPPTHSSPQICEPLYFQFDKVLIVFCRNKMIAESSESNPDEEFLENWTKWRLYLSVEPGNTVTVYPNTRLSLANMVNGITQSFFFRRHQDLYKKRHHSRAQIINAARKTSQNLWSNTNILLCY